MKVEWSPLALADREAIFDYAEARSARMAIIGDERISMSVLRLTSFPELGHFGRVEGTRELSVEGTPFVLVYRLKERRDDATVTILRVIHGSRRWLHRIE
ncbi:type II toxin-antitoxin system RelE/ParE family toxin [Paraburkholderia sp. J41]|uniref:type II toxin-antitoxin system RelE/ParE family toxin n=1 Tax=Paraburkholderia sp. J41 TaxID=2805433 RepID=UPI002AC3385C|nr:type II toxin-antitoxin system RelE/ParE family toxin [Paraburkholderia sp. J41]